MEKLIFGFHEDVFLLWLSASSYLIVTLLTIWPFRQEKNDLTITFLAFLYGMLFFHIFLGLGLYLDNLIFIHLGSFAALTGSALTLKFPLSSVSLLNQKLFLYLALIVAWMTNIWMLFPHQNLPMLSVVVAYMVVVTGGSGLYTLLVGIDAKKVWIKVRCIVGGASLIICCTIADLIALIAGISIFGELLMSAAPVVLLAGLVISNHLQKKEEPLYPAAIDSRYNNAVDSLR